MGIFYVNQFQSTVGGDVWGFFGDGESHTRVYPFGYTPDGFEPLALGQELSSLPPEYSQILASSIDSEPEEAQAEPEPEEAQAEPEPEEVRAEPEPEEVRAEPEPEEVRAEPEVPKKTKAK